MTDAGYGRVLRRVLRPETGAVQNRPDGKDVLIHGPVHALFVPRVATGHHVADLVVFLAGQAVLVLIVTGYRIDQVVRYYVVLFILALLALLPFTTLASF